MNTILEKATLLLAEKPYITIAFEGKSASGKTTIAKAIQQETNCNVIHMDDFFLPPNLRTKERYDAAGGNVHYERFFEQVIKNLDKDSFSYDIFSCSKMAIDSTVNIKRNRLTIIEGAYSMHPYFNYSYDLQVFFDIDCDKQLKRIEERNGKQMAQVFKDKWIPLENKYFSTYSIKEHCGLIIKA